MRQEEEWQKVNEFSRTYSVNIASKTKVPEPPTFAGSENKMQLHDWLSQIALYCSVSGITTDNQKIICALTCLHAPASTYMKLYYDKVQAGQSVGVSGGHRLWDDVMNCELVCMKCLANKRCLPLCTCVYIVTQLDSSRHDGSMKYNRHTHPVTIVVLTADRSVIYAHNSIREWRIKTFCKHTYKSTTPNCHSHTKGKKHSNRWHWPCITGLTQTNHEAAPFDQTTHAILIHTLKGKRKKRSLSQRQMDKTTQ